MNSQARRNRILIVDDHAAVRRGLRDLLAGFPDMEVLAEADDGPSALRLAAAATPDVVLLDAHLRGASGFDIGHQLRQVCAGARIILLTSQMEHEALAPSEMNGVDVYLLKSDADEHLATAIRKQTAKVSRLKRRK